jgi:hypothetical protein
MKIIHHGERSFKPNKKFKEKHVFEKLSETIIGAAIKVHKELDPGFLESIELKVGLLLNFAKATLEIKRVMN